MQETTKKSNNYIIYIITELNYLGAGCLEKIKKHTFFVIIYERDRDPHDHKI